jgi:hypothetical protein
MAVDYQGLSTLIAAFAAAVGTVAGALLSLRNGWKVDANYAKAAQISAKVDDNTAKTVQLSDKVDAVHEATNGLSDKLRVASNATSFEAGRQAGKNEN